MVTASRMQNMVQIRKKNIHLGTKPFFQLFFFPFRALGVESPRGGAMVIANNGHIVLSQWIMKRSKQLLRPSKYVKV